MANLRRPQATDSPVLSLRQPAGESQRGGGPSLSEMVSLASFLREPQMQQQQHQNAQQRQQQQQQGRVALQKDKQQFETEQVEIERQFEIGKEAVVSLMSQIKEQGFDNPEGISMVRDQLPKDFYEKTEMAAPLRDVVLTEEFYQTEEEEQRQIIDEKVTEAEALAAAAKKEYEAKESLRQAKLQDEIEQKQERFESLAGVRKGEREEEAALEREKTKAQEETENTYATLMEDDGSARVIRVPQGEEPPPRATGRTTEEAAQNYADHINKMRMERIKQEFEQQNRTDKQEVRAASIVNQQSQLKGLADTFEMITVDKKTPDNTKLKQGVPSVGRLKSEVLGYSNFTKNDLEKLVDEDFYNQLRYKGMKGNPVESSDGMELSGLQVKEKWEELEEALNEITNKDRLDDDDVDRLKTIWYSMLIIDSPELLDYAGKYEAKLPTWLGGEQPLVLKYQDGHSISVEDIELKE